MEPDMIIEYKWCIVKQEIHQEVIKTPQGTMIQQIPINIPVFFRNMDEVVRFLNEHKEQGASEITLYVGARDVSQPSEWVYPEESESEEEVAEEWKQ